ncbi:MAG: CdaR family protein [Peptostreptococcus sp.]|uniref:CdaR family protein n=1 Tax=Peptostreptococcus sp. TaxID=1262 RepID=UPI002FC721F3
MKNSMRKNNIRIKIISLVTALALWLYVIAIVDPDEKKVIENIPITITNASEVRNDDFVIYPKEEFQTDITVQGKLSEIQKLNKNNVHIYGELINPVEGQNIVNLKTNISNRVSRELKDNTFVVNLEKKVTKKVKVKIEVPDAIKPNVEEVTPEFSEVEVSGPRTLLAKVDYVGAVLKFDEKTDKPYESVELRLSAFDKNDKPIDVELSEKLVTVDVAFTVEKSVPVRINYVGEEYDKESLQLSPDKLTIQGKDDVVKSIESLETVKLEDKDLENLENKKVKISIPENVKIKGDISELSISKK